MLLRNKKNITNLASMKIWGFFIGLIFLVSCTGTEPKKDNQQYSSLFSITENAISTFSKSGIQLSKISSRQPYRKIVLLNAAFYAYFQALESSDRIVGILNKSSVLNVSNSIVDLGAEQLLNYEVLLKLNPDLVIGNAHQLQDLKNTELRTLAVDEFLEQDPKKRISFLMLVGNIIGKENEAKILFNKFSSQLKRYPLTNKRVGQLNFFGGNWYQPGCNTLVSNLIAHSGAEKVCILNSEKSELVDEEHAIKTILDIDYLFFVDWAENKTRLRDRLKNVLDINPKLKIIYCNAKQTNYFNKVNLKPGVVIHKLHNILLGNKHNELFEVIKF